jgi:glycosyltransferase involved in cell wall biosynthesis
LIPCYNEEGSIANVVRDFLGTVPDATVFVYDNNSTDRTAEEAAAAGATVRREPRKGKGHVIQRMFADIDADVYVLVDGDDTYDAASAPAIIERLCNEQLDLVNAARATSSNSAYRPGHRWGNKFFSRLVSATFGGGITDMMSGYKVFSRRFVKTFAGPASGFEIDTVLVIHALALGMPVAEVRTPFKERAAKSVSKLNTFRDGLAVLWTIFRLLLEEHPVCFFGTLALVSAALSGCFAYPPVLEYLSTGRLSQRPSALLAGGFLSLSILLLAVGLLVDLISLSRREIKRLRYLEIPPAQPPSRRADGPKGR